MSRAGRPQGGAGRVRIVAGEWRRRFVPVQSGPDLRPTPDRVRETLFNWLAPVLPGAKVLDAFAGTGILGLEALSRGAAHATFVERSRGLVRSLGENLATLGGSDRATLIAADAWKALAQPGTAMDVVFLDPPYRATAHGELCTLLQKNGWLNSRTRIYLEQDRERPPPDLPAPFTILQQATAGRVSYMLAAADEPD